MSIRKPYSALVKSTALLKISSSSFSRSNVELIAWENSNRAERLSLSLVMVWYNWEFSMAIAAWWLRLDSNFSSWWEYSVTVPVNMQMTPIGTFSMVNGIDSAEPLTLLNFLPMSRTYVLDMVSMVFMPIFLQTLAITDLSCSLES